MKARLALAIFFFVGWLAILLAGADRPPPPGFVWVVILDAMAGPRTPTESPRRDEIASCAPCSKASAWASSSLRW